MERTLLCLCCVFSAFSGVTDGSGVGVLKRFELSEGTCSLTQTDEECFANAETWYFDDSGEFTGCYNATEEKCGGKGNRFQTKDECEEKCFGFDESERNLETRSYFGYPHYYPGHYHHRHHGCWDHCHNLCPGGYLRCYSCMCIPVCQPVRCPGYCDTDLIWGHDGCRHCNCKSPCHGHDCCSHVHCHFVCQRPWYSHLHHCCNCGHWGGWKRPCRPCHNHCPHGYVDHPHDECPSCDCRDAPLIGHAKHGSHHLTDCTHLPCRRDCAFGCYVNQATCDTRVCLPSSRVLYRGRMLRQLGHHCPNIRATCKLRCPYGHVVDEQGCETCQCL